MCFKYGVSFFVMFLVTNSFDVGVSDFQFYKTDKQLEAIKQDCKRLTKIMPKWANKMEQGSFEDPQLAYDRDAVCYAHCILEKSNLAGSQSPSPENLRQALNLPQFIDKNNIKTCWSKGHSYKEKCMDSFEFSKCLSELAKKKRKSDHEHKPTEKSEDKVHAKTVDGNQTRGESVSGKPRNSTGQTQSGKDNRLKMINNSTAKSNSAEGTVKPSSGKSTILQNTSSGLPNSEDPAASVSSRKSNASKSVTDASLGKANISETTTITSDRKSKSSANISSENSTSFEKNVSKPSTTAASPGKSNTSVSAATVNNLNVSEPSTAAALPGKSNTSESMGTAKKSNKTEPSTAVTGKSSTSESADAAKKSNVSESSTATTFPGKSKTPESTDTAKKSNDSETSTAVTGESSTSESADAAKKSNVSESSTAVTFPGKSKTSESTDTAKKSSVSGPSTTATFSGTLNTSESVDATKKSNVSEPSTVATLSGKSDTSESTATAKKLNVSESIVVDSQLKSNFSEQNTNPSNKSNDSALTSINPVTNKSEHQFPASPAESNSTQFKAVDSLGKLNVSEPPDIASVPATINSITPTNISEAVDTDDPRKSNGSKDVDSAAEANESRKMNITATGEDKPSKINMLTDNSNTTNDKSKPVRNSVTENPKIGYSNPVMGGSSNKPNSINLSNNANGSSAVANDGDKEKAGTGYKSSNIGVGRNLNVENRGANIDNFGKASDFNVRNKEETIKSINSENSVPLSIDQNSPRDTSKTEVLIKSIPSSSNDRTSHITIFV